MLTPHQLGIRICSAFQLPVEHWHAWIGDATIADAILDRLLSRSQRLALKGESLRPRKTGGPARAHDAPTEPSSVTAQSH